MTQEEEWIEDEDTYDEDAEFINLEVGDSIEGIIVDIYPSKKFEGRKIYKIQEQGKDHPSLIFGTSMLDRKLSARAAGDEIRIIRENDQPSDKGNPLQVYQTYHKKAAAQTKQQTTGKTGKKSVFGGN